MQRYIDVPNGRLLVVPETHSFSKTCHECIPAAHGLANCIGNNCDRRLGV